MVSISESCQKQTLLTISSSKVHRAELGDENFIEDYELITQTKKGNSPIIISNIRELLTCMENYVSIKECDLIEWFR